MTICVAAETIDLTAEEEAAAAEDTRRFEYIPRRRSLSPQQVTRDIRNVRSSPMVSCGIVRG